VNRSLRDALEDFARGALSLPQLRESLAGIVDIDFDDSAARKIKMIEGANLPVIGFGREEVRNMLQRFLNFELDVKDLSDWATVIRMLDLHFTITESEPSLDIVWDVIDELMSYAARTDVGRKRVERLLEKLEQEA